MNSFLQKIPRLAAALAFAAASATALVVAAPPQAADAAVFVGVNVGGFHAGYANYPRWHWGGHAWIRTGYVYGRPGFVGTVGYVGYSAPPPPAFAVGVGYYPRPYYGPYYRPYWHGGYYGPAYYHRGYYGPAYYHRGYHRF